MCKLQLIAVFVLALCAKTSNALRGWGVGHTFYDQIGGRNVVRSSGGAWGQGRIFKARDLQQCAGACANDPTKLCKCTVFRVTDNYCSFKNYGCWNPILNMYKDPTNSHIVVAVYRPPMTLYKGGPWETHPAFRALPGPKPWETPKPTPKPPVQGFDGGQPVGDVKHSLMTVFHGFGIPYGGCGAPQDKMKDDNGKLLPYIALNTRTAAGGVGLFSEGNNCGRWVKITVGKPCGGPNDGSNIGSCLANFNDGPSDGKDGKVIYGYVADSCGDANIWCKQDTFHIDMGVENLVANGLATEGGGNWQNNRISWTFLDDTPAGLYTQTKLNWQWCIGAKLDWQCLVVSGLSNGISRVEALMNDGSWDNAYPQYLQQQFVLPASNAIKIGDGRVRVRAYDLAGKMYGEYSLISATAAPTPVLKDAD